MSSVCNFLRSLCAYPKPQEQEVGLVNTDFHTIITEAEKQINKDSIEAVDELFMNLYGQISQQNKSASKKRNLPNLIPYVSYQNYHGFQNYGFHCTEEEMNSIIKAIQNNKDLKDSRKRK